MEPMEIQKEQTQQSDSNLGTTWETARVIAVDREHYVVAHGTLSPN